MRTPPVGADRMDRQLTEHRTVGRVGNIPRPDSADSHEGRVKPDPET